VDGRVLITSGDARTCLAAVRSLGRNGIEVKVADEERMPLAGFSRYCRGVVRYPPPRRDPERFLTFLSRHLRKERYGVVLPVEQDMFYLFSKHRDELGRLTKIPVAKFSAFQTAYDKALTFKAAAALGIPAPTTFFVESRAEVEELARRIQFPVVVKPRMGSGSRAVGYAANATELLTLWQEVHLFQPRPLIQERIPSGGETIGVSVLFNLQSELRACFVHRRIREFPLSGGPSTLRESVSRPEIADVAIRFLQELGWSGVAMVEFKVDPRDGVAKLIEVNPKFWGSLNLAIASGVDFPALLYRTAVDGDVAPVLQYRLGVRSRFLPGDLLHFLANPNRWRIEPPFFRFREPGTFGDIWDSSDRLPGFAFPLIMLWRGWRPGAVRHVLRRSKVEQGVSQQVEKGDADPSVPEVPVIAASQRARSARGGLDG
jgi:predicted ATP-grasp superfamily ATP-dependent carboligase